MAKFLQTMKKSLVRLAFNPFLHSTEEVPETCVSEVPQINGFMESLTRLFFISTIFLPYLMIFQSGAHRRCCKPLKIHQIQQKFSQKKNKENPLSTLPSIHFSANFRYPKINFRVPVLPLSLTSIKQMQLVQTLLLYKPPNT